MRRCWTQRGFPSPTDARISFSPVGDPKVIPLGEKGWDQGWMLAIARQLSVMASVPLTQRAFRSPAGARVTFLLLAQKKSNPKKTASKAGSTPWDRSVGRFARANSWLPKAGHSGYTATRRSGEDLKQARPTVETLAVSRCANGHQVAHALSPQRIGALRCSRCVSAMGRNLSVWPRPSGWYPAPCNELFRPLLWVTFILGQQKKSDPDRGSGSERPLRKRHPCRNARL